MRQYHTNTRPLSSPPLGDIIKNPTIEDETNGRLTTSILQISGINISAFPVDRQKEVRLIQREITAGIRKLRDILNGK